MPKTKLQNCLLLPENHFTMWSWSPWRYKNAKTSAAFLNKAKFLVNLFDLMSTFILLELRAFFVNPFSKRL